MSNKRDIVKKLAGRTLLTQKESESVVNELLKLIEEEVVSTGELKLVGFGRFFLYEHSSRPVRNPMTKKEMMLDPFKSIKFKASGKLKSRVKENTKE